MLGGEGGGERVGGVGVQFRGGGLTPFDKVSREGASIISLERGHPSISQFRRGKKLN